MRIVVLVLVGGCTSMLGLEKPRRLDASTDSAPPVVDAAVDARFDAPIDTFSMDGCPSSYALIGGSRYRMITNAITWIDAANMCAADGGSGLTPATHLAVIRDNTERASLTAFNGINIGVFWLGLSDRVTEGQYLWVTAENTAGYPPHRRRHRTVGARRTDRQRRARLPRDRRQHAVSGCALPQHDPRAMRVRRLPERLVALLIECLVTLGSGYHRCMVRVLLVAMSLAGCAQIFGLDSPHHAMRDAGEDAQLDDGAPMVDSTTAPDAPADVTTAGCPSSYTESLGFSVYRVVSTQVPWAIAANDCGDDATKTHLVVIGSNQERQFVDNLANNGAWIGLSDRVAEGQFRWVTSEPVPVPPDDQPPWAPNEPNGGAAADCGFLDNGEYQDVACEVTAAAYVCECDGYANDPTRY